MLKHGRPWAHSCSCNLAFQGEDIVVAGRGMVVLDGEGIEGERPQVVDAPADARLAVGVVAGHRGTRQGQGRSGVVVSAAAQAGTAAVPVRLR